jgi:hypothetical protein
MARAQKRRARARAKALGALTRPHPIKPELSSGEQARRVAQSTAALQVVDEHEAADVLNLSVDTLRRLVRSGDGPIRLNLSARRIGNCVGDLADWLDKRASKPVAD